MRLRTKFAIVLVAVTLVLSGITYGGLEFFKQQQVADTQNNVQDRANLTARQIASVIQEEKDTVAYVASRPKATDFSVASEYAASFANSSRFFAAQIIAANGTVVAFRGAVGDAARRRTIGSDRSDTSYFQASMRGNTNVTTPEQIGDSDSHIVLISAPIFDRNQTVVGVMVGAIRVNTLTFLQAAKPLNTSEQSVRVHAARIVNSTHDVLYAEGEQYDRSIDGQAAVPLEGIDWTVAVTYNRADLAEDLQSLRVAQALGILIVFVSALGFGYWEYSANLRQTERLLDGFGAIGRGEYDYHLELSAGDEWRQINDGFNELSDELASREAALREREQRLEVLYRVLRHNIRNEMTIILNYADLIQDFSEDETIEQSASTILDTGQTITQLSHKAKQIESAVEGPDSERADIEVIEVLENVVDDIQGDFPDAEIIIEGDPPVYVEASTWLELAFENVLENACQHNDADDPEVTVTVTDDDGVSVTFADNGPGIPEDEYAVLYEGRETALEHGSGLGLWIVYWIVDSSDGAVHFGENEPRGSVVTLDLQRGRAPEERDAESDAEAGDGEDVGEPTPESTGEVETVADGSGR